LPSFSWILVSLRRNGTTELWQLLFGLQIYISILSKQNFVLKNIMILFSGVSFIASQDPLFRFLQGYLTCYLIIHRSHFLQMLSNGFNKYYA